MGTSIGGETDNRRNWGMVALVIAVAIVLFGVGLLVGRGLSPESADPRTERSPADDVGPTDFLNGVPVGYSRSEQGAVAAATNFARVMSGPAGSPQSYRDAMRTVAAPQWVPRAEELATRAIQFVDERYGQEGRVTFVPVRYRVTSYSDAEATIDLWGSALGSGSKVERIEQSWTVATIELEWVEDDWRVAGESSRAGPATRALEPPAGMVGETLQGFQEYEYGPAP